jgi:hypothetical protein
MEATKCCREILRLAYFEHSQLNAQRPASALGFLHNGLCCVHRGLVVGREQQHDSLLERKRLAQQLYSLAAQLDIELGEARDVSSGSREACNEP